MNTSPLALATLTLTALPAIADATAMCVDTGKTEEVCTCATEALAEDVSDEDAASYSAIGTLIVANREAGQGWDAVVAGVAEKAGVRANELQKVVNPVGKTHREAIKGCE